MRIGDLRNFMNRKDQFKKIIKTKNQLFLLIPLPILLQYFQIKKNLMIKIIILKEKDSLMMKTKSIIKVENIIRINNKIFIIKTILKNRTLMYPLRKMMTVIIINMNKMLRIKIKINKKIKFYHFRLILSP